MFEQGTVSRGDETAWVSGDNGTIVTVKKVMRKNNILFTRKAYEVRGGLFDQQLVKKGNGQIPIKGNSYDDRLCATEKYGAYNKASGAYFMLVESEDKKGNKIRTLEFVPVYLAKEMEKSEDMNEKTRLLTETNKTLIDDTNTLSSTSEEISASSEETCAMCSDNAERFKTVNNVIAELTADAGKMNVFIEEYDRMHTSDTEEIHETVERTA